MKKGWNGRERERESEKEKRRKEGRKISAVGGGRAPTSTVHLDADRPKASLCTLITLISVLNTLLPAHIRRLFAMATTGCPVLPDDSTASDADAKRAAFPPFSFAPRASLHDPNE